MHTIGFADSNLQKTGERRMSSTNRGVSLGLNLAAFFAGVLFLAGGLIFLCAAVQNPARWPVALVLLLIGGGLAAWAGVRWRRTRELMPEVLDDRITSLADRYDAEVTLAQVVSDLTVPDEAARVALARLEASGLCHQEQREGRVVYLFPGLKESKVVRRCAYCGNEYSVREPLHKCPNCGGQLEIVKT
jgi:membrane protein implicated in regulation of membrane protease activity